MKPTSRIARLLLVLGCATWLTAALAQSPSTHQHGFEDAERWAQVFDDPKRDGWQRPVEVIGALDLAPDALVADIGAGTGYFSVRLAKAVPQGRVYAVDIEPDMVRYLRERARDEGLDNLVAISGSPDDPHLPQKVDVALVVDTFHHIEQREDYFRRLSEALRPGGRVAIIDFRFDSPIGPPEAMRLAVEEVTREMQAAGYALVEEHAFLLNQYFLIFEPASRS